MYYPPSQKNLSFFSNFGSLLGVTLLTQIMTGVFLSFHYLPSLDIAFNSVITLSHDSNTGWLIRSSHSKGASFFFIFLYAHIARNFFYSSYTKKKNTWTSGVTILILTMATAFLGYVLPWGQMSYWGATVITNLLSSIPFLGVDLVSWLWGGYSVSGPTLTRFFSLHFILPFIISVMTIAHLIFLHAETSSNPLNIQPSEKVSFSPYYSLKDILGVNLSIFMTLSIIFFFPTLWENADNSSSANPLVTPTHIQPEWYFLFAYAILRSIPNKLGGVSLMLASIMGLYLVPLILVPSKFNGLNVNPANRVMFIYFLTICFLLTWIGMMEVEEPFYSLGQLATIAYFTYFFMCNLMNMVWDKFTMP